ncbi:hypothetical protein SUDANB146_02655 [Streptomyces sp. enrichment culture]
MRRGTAREAWAPSSDVPHAVRQQLGTGDLSIVSERDPYEDRARAEVRIWTLETTMGTWAELP